MKKSYHCEVFKTFNSISLINRFFNISTVDELFNSVLNKLLKSEHLFIICSYAVRYIVYFYHISTAYLVENVFIEYFCQIGI